MKKISNYSISTDIGTNSVGYSVTDENGKLIRFKGKNMWGVNLFCDGVSAAERRSYRSVRRRYDRRKNRINLLQSIIGDDVCLKDENFFLRLKESALWNEDKSVDIKSDIYTLFNNADFTEKEYYKNYPTIYHLRKHLCVSTDKVDIRLVYLALHHIVKYRGNFLYEGDSNISAKNSEILPSVQNLCEALSAYFECSKASAEDISSILEDKKLKRTDKELKIVEAFGAGGADKNIYKNIAKAIIGNKADYKIIFSLESDSKITFRLSDENIDDELEKHLDDEQLDVFEAMKKVYSSFLLSEIIKGDNVKCISDAMITKYDKHRRDLKELKKLIRDTCSNDDYDEMFKGKKSNGSSGYVKTKTANYTSYINGFEGQKTCTRDDFYAYCKRFLENNKQKMDNNPLYKKILEEIENEEFMPKINSKDNGAIPYQLHLEEMATIIDNQGVYYPSLIKNKDKLLSIVSFRIPYYVGPLNEKRNPVEGQMQFAWLKRKEDGKIYPWNFEDIINIDETADRFIERMRNKCTYLPKEDVIPKQSLLFSEFEVRNEIKQIKLNDKFLDLSIQKALHDEVFTEKKNVSETMLRNWLVLKKVPNAADGKITGFQKEGKFASSLTSYIDFKKILGEFPLNKMAQIEKIIHWITVFEDKKILRRKLKNEMPEFTESQREKMCKLNYSGWSSLSRKLLEGIYVYDSTGKKKNIICEMCNSTKNFMQIINDEKLGFKTEIEKEAKPENITSITNEVIDSLAGSPAIKRGIKQTVDVVAEIVKIMGKEPQNIYIEFAREEGEKKRTSTRRKQLDDIYTDLKKSREFSDTINCLKEIDDKLLNDKMVYLYFLQNGKSMYSGKPLDLKALSQTCQIDHIIPQSYIKDDSIDNTVLVLSGENQDKGDDLLVSAKVRERCFDFWRTLYDNKIISAKKYYNLNRDHFVENDLKGFINRQIVETRQITKHVANLFGAVYKNTKIIQIKAQLSSDLRHKEGLYKCRDLNDYHHAHDAYIAATLGRYISICFPQLNDEFDYKSYRKYIKNLKGNKDFRKEEFGYIINNFENVICNAKTGEIVWDGRAEKDRLFKCLGYNDCFISRKLEEQTGSFYKQTVYPKTGEADTKLIKRKANMPVSKYGGFKEACQAYMLIVEYDDKNIRKRELAGIPLYIAKENESKPGTIMKYLNENYKNVKLISERKILKYQKILWGSNEFYISSSNEVHNAKQLILPQECSRIIYSMNDPVLKNKITDENLEKLYTILIDKIKTNYQCFNTFKKKLEDAFDEFCKKSKEDKAAIISQILLTLHANPTNGNFARFNLGDLKGREGRLIKSPCLKDVVFVNTSVTGMFENPTHWEDF